MGRGGTSLSGIEGWGYGSEERLSDPESLLHDPEFVEKVLKEDLFHEQPTLGPPRKRGN